MCLQVAQKVLQYYMFFFVCLALHEDKGDMALLLDYCGGIFVNRLYGDHYYRHKYHTAFQEPACIYRCSGTVSSLSQDVNITNFHNRVLLRCQYNQLSRCDGFRAFV